MIYNMNINICIGLLFFGFLIKIINLYRNFYKVCKNLDTDQRIKFFYNKYIVSIISKFGIIKNFFIFFVLIPIIKINYFILSIFISLIHSLCEVEYDNFMEKNGFSFSDFSHDEIEKILNNSDDEINNKDFNITQKNDDFNNDNIEKNKILENKEKLIDEKIQFYMINQENIHKLNIKNLEDYTSLENLISNNDFNFDFNSNIDIEELKKDMNIINEGIEVLKIDEIDFGEKFNTLLNNFNNVKDNKSNNNNSDNIVVIRTGKKKFNK